MSYISTVKTLGKATIETTISFDNDATLAEFLYLILDKPNEAEVKEEESALDIIHTAITEYKEKHNQKPASIQLGPRLKEQVSVQSQILFLDGMTLYGVFVDQKGYHPDLYIEIEE